MIKWYMRVLLVFHTMHQDIKEYKKPGQTLYVRTLYKECCGKVFVYKREERLFHKKGSVAKRIRRRDR